MLRYLAEPRNILAESLSSAEPRLKNTFCILYNTFSLFLKQTDNNNEIFDHIRQTAYIVI
jgi:hypothetical protein